MTDPFLRHRLGPLERHGPRPDPGSIGVVDVVLVSHGHQDHFDPASLGALEGRPTVVVPRGLGSAARRAVEGDVIELTAGERTVVAGMVITATPARHWIAPGAPRAQPVGYVFGGGPHIYFAGDTGRFPGMRRARRCGRRRAAPDLDVGSSPRPGAPRPAVGGRGARGHRAGRRGPDPLGDAVSGASAPCLAAAADRTWRAVRRARSSGGARCRRPCPASGTFDRRRTCATI